MESFKFLPLALVCICGAASAQTTATASSTTATRLPGSDQEATHFHFDEGKSKTKQLASNLGQGAARIIAQKHAMGGVSVVDYAPAAQKCKIKVSDKDCP